MYTQYFSLKQPPFSIAPDPRYLFMSERHREALAHLLYGVESGGGFVLLTGEIGAGKTTVCRCFIEQIPANCRLAYIFNPKLTVEELLLSICEEFGIAPLADDQPTSVKRYVDAINVYLLASHAGGRNNVLVIDEAQNLSAAVLEQLRLLTNLETSERKLLQIILIGQPELRTMLARPELEQLAQRVIARYHLGPLTESETASYVTHRMTVAGATAATPFPARLAGLIFTLARGVPRRVNLLCDRALLGAYVEGKREVTRTILKRAAAEVFADADGARAGVHAKARWPLAVLALAGCVAVSAAAWHLLPQRAAVSAAAPQVAAAQKKAPPPASMPASAPASAPASLPAPVPTPAPLVLETEQDALRQLAAMWGQPLADGEACAQALKVNLRCHQGKGGLYDLRLLDRPAVVTLHDGAAVGYAVITAMNADSVTLRAGGASHTLPIASLATRFDGAITTFWSAPPSYREQVAGNGRGADVDWIAASLARLDGQSAPGSGQVLDAALQARLKRFQAAQGLKADGVAGPRTYMRLSQLTGVAEPRLLAATATGKQ